jgi:flagellar basal body-associated protein FliL
MPFNKEGLLFLLPSQRYFFYRTKKGIIIIVLVILIIIGAVVGGVVGTRKQNSKAVAANTVGKRTAPALGPAPRLHHRHPRAQLLLPMMNRNRNRTFRIFQTFQTMVMVAMMVAMMVTMMVRMMVAMMVRMVVNKWTQGTNKLNACALSP